MEEKIIYEMKRLINKANKKNESPIVAIITLNNKIIAKAYNKRNKSNKTIDHAEIIAITKANKKIKNWRLNKCTLYISLEPCDMCKNVIKESRIDKVIYLIKRNPTKKQYNKSNFEEVNSNNLQIQKFIEEYKKIIHNFWENKR